MSIAFLLLFSVTDRSPIIECRVDMAELNHIVSWQEFDGIRRRVEEKGSYWVFWEWNPKRERYCVVSWVSSTDASRFGDILTARVKQRICRIRPVSFRETWTFYDREVESQAVDAKDYWERPGLFRE